MDFNERLDQIFEGLGTSRFTKFGMPIKRRFTPDPPEEDEGEKLQREIDKLNLQKTGDEDHDAEIDLKIKELENSFYQS
jgi:hypothetical protein